MVAPAGPRDIQFTTSKGAHCFVGMRDEGGQHLTDLGSTPWMTLGIKQTNGEYRGIAASEMGQFNRTTFDPDNHRRAILKRFMDNMNKALLNNNLVDGPLLPPDPTPGATNWTDLNSSLAGIMAMFTHHTGLEESDVVSAILEWKD